MSIPGQPDQSLIRASNVAGLYVQLYADALPRPLLEKPSPDAAADAQMALSSFGFQNLIATLGLTSGSLTHITSLENYNMLDLTGRGYIFDSQIHSISLGKHAQRLPHVLQQMLKSCGRQDVRAITYLYSVRSTPPPETGRSPRHFPTDILIVLYNRSSDPLGARMLEGKEEFYAIGPRLSGILYNSAGGDLVIKVKGTGMPVDKLDTVVDKLIRRSIPNAKVVR